MTPDELKSWRHALGWTQERAAREVCISTSQYRNWEHGRTPINRRHVVLINHAGAAEAEARRRYSGGGSSSAA